MLSRFFIHRPNFAIVIAVVITLAGLLALSVIAISQYPNITPPTVTVSATYPGASAETIAKTLGQPIEEQVNGVPGELYMQSTSSSSGTYNLRITFAIGTDLNIDQVNVQNRVQLAEAQLPTEVQQEGLTIRASSADFVLAVNLFSPTHEYDQVFISNYVYMHVQPQIARISGVGNTQIFGEREYAMRIWLNPVRMTALGITASDVAGAIAAQNIQPSAALAVFEAPNANGLAVAHAVEQEMRTIAAQFPPGLEYAIVYNATNFVSADIAEITKTLAITLVLVVAVVYVFLQDWRATLIPTVAIPVSLIGVFAVLYLLGYSANTVDLFAIVLAITLVVDDAIVVVENVSRHLSENPRQPIAEATEQAMAEITGPVVATTLVLVAVFAPVGFISGITGALYRQFAVTISVSIVISAINALTLSPALCALMLRPPRRARFFAFRWFNRSFVFARDRYGHVVRLLSRRLLLAAIEIVAAFAFAYLVLGITPSAFLPSEDQGYFFINVQMPNGASLERTQRMLRRVGDMVLKTPGVAHVIEIGGFSLVTGAQEPNAGSVIPIMAPFSQRGPSESIPAVIARLQPRFNAIPGAEIVSFAPPAIPGISRSGGINFVLEARAGQSYQKLAAATRALIFAANQNPNLHSVFTSFSARVPQIMVHVDTTRAALMGVTPAAIYQTLEANLGGQFVNNCIVLASFVGVLFVPALFVAFALLRQNALRLPRSRQHHPAE